MVAALGFEEGYTRVYLGLHWFTDTVSGFIYGCLLLCIFIAAVRLIAGPARGHARAAATAEDFDARVGRPVGEVQVARSALRVPTRSDCGRAGAP